MLAQLVTALPSRDAALALARDVVERRLAACVQVIDPITSVYRWEGTIREEPESLLLMKVPAERAGALAAHVRSAHPYDTPEIAVMESSFVDERYLAWATEETGSAR
jgi:periplasmic divalent cation tolerance protein